MSNGCTANLDVCGHEAGGWGLVLGAPNNLVQFAHGMAGIVLKNDRSLITISVVTICKTVCMYFDNGPKYQTVIYNRLFW